MKTVDLEKSAQRVESASWAPPSRRSFLDYLLGTSAIATLGAILYPIFKFMSPPQVIESTESSVVADLHASCPVAI